MARFCRFAGQPMSRCLPRYYLYSGLSTTASLDPVVLLLAAPMPRDRPEIKDTVGFFVNMQCIRADVDDRTTFRGLLRKVQIAVTESFVNQDIHLRIPFPSCKLGAAYRDSLLLN